MATQATDGPVDLRMQITNNGLVEGHQSPQRGQIITVPSHAAALRMIRNGYAQLDLTGPLRQPYEPSR
jgi:hypothetical protein